MSACWNTVDKRPTFKECFTALQQLFERKELYATMPARFLPEESNWDPQRQARQANAERNGYMNNIQCYN